MSRTTHVTPWTDYKKVGHSQFRSAAFRLFKFTYKAAAPDFYFHSDFDITKKGLTVFNSDQTITQSRLDMVRDADCSPAFLAMVVASGGHVTVYQIEDLVKIYDDIVEHLNDWYTYITKVGIYREVPIDDLYGFEQLAMDFHEHVQAYRQRDPISRDNMVKFTGRFGSWQQDGLSAYKPKVYVPIVPEIEREVTRATLDRGRLTSIR